MISGIAQDQIARNYPGVSPLFGSAIAACIAALVLFYMPGGKGED
jgi:hypothetical protein